MSVGWVALGASVVGQVMDSKAQKKQAQTQADAISDAGDIDSAARNKAIGQVLEIFGPSLVDFNKSIQGSIDLMEQGRISTGDLLAQSAQNVSQITQQGGQSALNAMLGLPAPENTPANQQQITQQPQGNQQGIAADGLPELPKGGYQEAMGGINPNLNPNQLSDNNVASNNMGPFPVGSQGYLDDIAAQEAASSAYQPTTPLEGELLPRDYNFNQQGVNMPQGTGAGLSGAVNAVQSGADLGRFDLAQGATGALNSLNTQTGIARGDIGQGRDFALNKVQEAIQAGRAGIDLGINSINQGAQQGVNAINQGASRGVDAVNQGVNRGTSQIWSGARQGVSEIGRGVDQATSYLNPYMDAGQEALNPLLDLSGVRGQDAFNSALINDPAYNYALKNSETSLARNAAVTGGVGSGNTGARFQQNAQDMGAANIDNQLNRFRAITESGQQAASTAGGYETQGGIASGNVLSQAGANSGSLATQGGIASGNIYNQAGANSGAILNQAGTNVGQLQATGGELEANQLNKAGDISTQSSQQLADLARQLGMSEAQVLESLGGNLANIDTQTGNTIGGMNEQAGINAANIIQGTSNQQAGIDAGLAQQLASLDQETLNNVVNSMQSGAGTNLSSQQQLATILANMGIGAGTSAANTAINLGQANALGITNPVGNAINTGIGLYASGAFNQGATNPYQPYNGGYGNNGADYSNITNDNWGGI